MGRIFGCGNETQTPANPLIFCFPRLEWDGQRGMSGVREPGSRQGA